MNAVAETVAEAVAPTPVVAVHADPQSKRGQIIQIVQEQMKSCVSALEIGAGHFEMIGALRAPIRVGVEIHKPYIDRRICDPCVVAICADASQTKSLFPAKSFDGVMMIDFVEHFEKHAALELIDTAESIARSTVVIHCPLGHHPQEGDAFGLGGEEFQRHRSEWEPSDFTSRGYAIAVIDNLFDDKDGCDPRAIVAVKRF